MYDFIYLIFSTLARSIRLSPEYRIFSRARTSFSNIWNWFTDSNMNAFPSNRIGSNSENCLELDSGTTGTTLFWASAMSGMVSSRISATQISAPDSEILSTSVMRVTPIDWHAIERNHRICGSLIYEITVARVPFGKPRWRKSTDLASSFWFLGFVAIFVFVWDIEILYPIVREKAK